MKFSTLHVVQIVVFIFASSNSAQMHKNPQSDRLYTIKNEKLHVSITTRCSTRISLLYAYFRILLKHDRPFLRPPFASLCRAFSKYLVLRYFLRYRSSSSSKNQTIANVKLGQCFRILRFKSKGTNLQNRIPCPPFVQIVTHSRLLRRYRCNVYELRAVPVWKSYRKKKICSIGASFLIIDILIPIFL